MAPRPTPPTSSLPPLSRLASYSLAQVSQAVDNLRTIYCTSVAPTKPSLILPTRKALPKHLIHDTSVPDSGYASAEGEEDDEEQAPQSEDASYDPDVLRSDSFEREFAIRWLTGFAARSDAWVDLSDDEAETDARAALVDAAASVLATFAGEEEEEAITRTFTFPTGPGPEAVHVELNDAPLLSDDHTSVGLQSWGSSILLAERMCMHPSAFGLVPSANTSLRILELGAGTGLLSIAAAKLLGTSPPSAQRPSIVATDYHPSVLANLRSNVENNFPPPTERPVDVLALDWQNPVYEGVLSEPFDVILAADVVYHPEHARWIKACVERLLVRDCGVFWLIIPIRPTGRHEGMSNTVEAVFPRAEAMQGNEGRALAILSVEGLSKHNGVGRADEGGYRMYKIGWV
ncbi:putative methyltransferase-domain-containing protein [Trametes polyzona]|nr:putative methyltransferase-domain-containing protein [Trametes polyzona]